MNILKELSHLDEKIEIADQLKQEKFPLVMYGAGQMAVEVIEYLKMNDIKLDGIFVDDEYYWEGMKFEGQNVILYDELAKKYNKVNIIFGNSYYEKIRMFEEKKNVNKVFCLFSASYGVYKKTPLDVIEDNIKEFEDVYDLWEDDASRRNYLAFLKTRVSGNNQYIWDMFFEEMNFFNNDVFRINDKEVFLDVGAYDGDTIRLFLKESLGKYKRIYALEPDKANRDKLKKYVNEMKLHDVILTEKGAWNKEEVLSFCSNNAQISGVELEKNKLMGSENIVVKPLDILFGYSEKVTILKINYLEGVKEAVQGATKILKNHMPKIAITVGYDCRNIRYIPMLIKHINSNYKLYLRYNRGMASALVLYGII